MSRCPLALTMLFCTNVMFCSTISSRFFDVPKLPVTPGMFEGLPHFTVRSWDTELDGTVAVFRVLAMKTVDFLTRKRVPLVIPTATRWQDQVIVHDFTRKHVSNTWLEILTMVTRKINFCEHTRWIGGIHKSSSGFPHFIFTFENFLDQDIVVHHPFVTVFSSNRAIVEVSSGRWNATQAHTSLVPA